MPDERRINGLLRFLGGLMLVFGILLIAVPFVFWWYVSDYDRYIAMIRGPFPFNHLGSGPLQLWGAFFTLGWGSMLVLTATATVRDHRLLARNEPLRALQAVGLLIMGAFTLLFLTSPIITLIGGIVEWLR